MKKALRIGVLSAAVGLLGVGCAPTVCERGAGLASKAGSCASAVANPLAPTGTCGTRFAVCSASDQQAVTDAIACLEKLATCDPASELAYLAQQSACLSPLRSLAGDCSQSLFGGVVPGTDGGSDGGSADAGRQPTDAGAIELVAVADETTFALAWVATQTGQAAKWELNLFVDGGRAGEQLLTPGTTRTFTQRGAVPLLADGGAGPGQERGFFLAGLLNDGTVVMGSQPDAGGYTFQCLGPLDCAADKVCDLGQCKTVACSSSANNCPTGYDCPVATCTRSADAGFRDAGQGGNTGNFTALPFISNLGVARTGKPSWAAALPVGGFVSKRPDMVAIDSARQFIAVEQENQPVGHLTVRRGKELVDDQATSSIIDTVGDHIQVTYVPDSDTIFACYSVGRGVRVRRSRDHGRTWGTDALTFEPADDGGYTSRFHSCDLAPWRNGSAVMVDVEDDLLVVRTLTEALSLSNTEVAFASSPTDGGGANVYNPTHPSIATAPDAGILHVGFTGQRALASASDLEVYDVVRTGSTGAFGQPLFVNRTTLIQGNGQNQDNVSIAVDPNNGRAVAAYTSAEGTGSTVYTSLFLPAVGEWGTGADLTIFANQTTEYLLFPSRPWLEPWDAFSPTVRSTADGRFWLGFVAGKKAQPPATTKNDYRAYAVRFDWDIQSPISFVKAWYVRPAEKVSDTVVFDPRAASSQVPPTISTLAVDDQVSVYSAYVEGIGQFNEIENRAVYSSRP